MDSIGDFEVSESTNRCRSICILFNNHVSNFVARVIANANIAAECLSQIYCTKCLWENQEAREAHASSGVSSSNLLQ